MLDSEHERLISQEAVSRYVKSHRLDFVNEVVEQAT